ncbi:MAG: PAS domain S-box protein [Kiritimatiellaeota bacterium]|nr:PAS domain S-box protein [Kiritimatiellota bacterium]
MRIPHRTMRRAILFLCLAAMAADPTSRGAPPTTPPGRTVRVGLYENPPKIFVDEHGDPDGFWAVLVQHIARQAGWRVQWVHGTWKQCLTRLANKEIDVLPDTGWTPERARQFAFCTETPVVSWCRLYTSREANVESILDLNGKTIAGLANSFDLEGPQGLKDLARSFGLTCRFLEMPSYDAIFRAVRKKTADAGLADGDFGRLNARRYGLKSTPVIIQPTRMLFAFPKDAPMTPRLIAEVDSNLARLKRDKRSIYYQAKKTFLGPRGISIVKEVVPHWAKTLLAVLGGALFFVGAVAFVSRTQVRRRTAALRLSEERFRLAFMTNPDAINLNRLADGLFVDVNDGFTNITGYTREEVIGKTSREISIWANIEDRERMMQGLQNSGKVANLEAPFRLKDGRIATGLLSASLITLNGETHIISITRDISELKRTQQALRASEARFRRLFEESPVALWEEDCTVLLAHLDELYRSGVPKTDLNAWLEAHPEALAACTRHVRIVNVNAAAVAQFQAKNKEELRRSWERTFSENSFEAFREAVVAVAEGRTSFGMEAEMQTLRGRRIDVSVHFSLAPKRGSDLDSTHTIIVATVDVTPIKRAERALKQSLYELRELHELSARIRANLSPEVVAKETIALAGKAVGADIALFFACRDDRLELLASETGTVPLGPEAMRHREVVRCLCGPVASAREPVYSKDIRTDPRCRLDECNPEGIRSFAGLPLIAGDRVLGLVALASVAERDFERERVFLETLGNEVAIGFQNAQILERLRKHQAELERRVRERTAELEAVNRELEAFSYSVSHDLRGPLRAIDGFSRILAEEYEQKLDDEAHRLIDVVRDNTRRMAQLIDDLLAFSRVSRHPIERRVIDMSALARAVYAELIDDVQRTRVRLTVQEMPPARADSSLMRQVFANLIANALKFTAREETARIEIGSKIENGETVYYISDNGVGFDMQYSDKLFQVFQRLHPQEEFGGTGIGLSIVERIVVRHGGRVWAESELGRGATFYLALPNA